MRDPFRRPVRVLLVEQEPEALPLLRKTFEEMEEGRYQVEWVGELARALHRLSLGGVDVVLLDLELPDSEGLASFERTHAFAPDVPIVVLSSVDDEKMAIRTVQGGAQDYLVKGMLDEYLLVRSIRYAMERHRLLSALRSLSLIDDLTGLYNRRGFMDLGDQHLDLARRKGRALALVSLDLDGFRKINDAHGHHVGDRVLLRTAELLRSTFRRSDLVARIGADEFAVLALEASGEDGEMLLDRIRSAVEAFAEDSSEPFPLSVSGGMARYEDGTRPRLDDLLSRADEALDRDRRRKREGAE